MRAGTPGRTSGRRYDIFDGLLCKDEGAHDNGGMLASASPTEIAFLMVALIQGVFAVVWGIGAYAVPTARNAVLYWVAWAALSALTWAILAFNVEQPPLPAVLCGVVAVMALQRGIRIFIGETPPQRVHLALLGVELVAFTIGADPANRPAQAMLNYGVLSFLYLYIATDLYRHARDRLQFRWPIVLALPVLFGSLAYGSRVVRAGIDPPSVISEMAADSPLNVNGALIFVVLVLSLHATLMVLVVARLVSELRRLSRHDALTGLLNRRAMEELLEEQVQRSRRTGEGFVLMMADLDHFKRINDQHGHPVGDAALRHVAALLRQGLPPSSSLARFGGEEFVILLRASGIRQSAEVAERLRESLSSSPLPHQGSAIALSVSIGVAQWREPGDDLAQLLLRADGALFQAKVQGRNRVVLSIDGRTQEPAIA